MTPLDQLHGYAKRGDIEGIRKAHEQDPALIHAPSPKDGSSALHSAARYGNAATSYYLLTTTGANPQLKDHHGARPIDIAAVSKHRPSIQLLVEATFPETELQLRQDLSETHAAGSGILTDDQLRSLQQFEPDRTRGRNPSDNAR
ncbi:MAG: ankyrin repeat domain-containing protein [Pseudomonadota bacterium]